MSGKTEGKRTTYGEMRLFEEEQFSAYGFDYADVEKLWEHLRLYEAECLGLLEKAKGFAEMDGLTLKRFPVLGAYELALKCSQVFNLLDARGAISVTERVGGDGKDSDACGGGWRRRMRRRKWRWAESE